MRKTVTATTTRTEEHTAAVPTPPTHDSSVIIFEDFVGSSLPQAVAEATANNQIKDEEEDWKELEELVQSRKPLPCSSIISLSNMPSSHDSYSVAAATRAEEEQQQQPVDSSCGGAASASAVEGLTIDIEDDDEDVDNNGGNRNKGHRRWQKISSSHSSDTKYLLSSATTAATGRRKGAAGIYVHTTTTENSRNSEREEGEGDDDGEKKSAVIKIFKGIWGNGKYATGVILILVVAVIWVAASVWIQYIFGGFNYNKPYFLTFFNTCGFGGWNLGFLCSQSWRDVPREPVEVNGDILLDQDDDGDDGAGETEFNSDDERSATVVSANSVPVVSQVAVDTTTTAPPAAISTNTPDEDKTAFNTENVNNTIPPSTGVRKSYGSNNRTHRQHRNPSSPPVHHQNRMYSLRRLATSALIFCPLWFGANCLFNYSLSATSVASNTILSTTSSIWTMIFSYFLLGQPILRIHKIAAVLLCIGGSVLVALSDHDGGSDGGGNHGNNATTTTTTTTTARSFSASSSSTSSSIVTTFSHHHHHITFYRGYNPQQDGVGDTNSRKVDTVANDNEGGNNNNKGGDGIHVSPATKTIIGDLLALLSAVFYGAYTTTLKWCLPSESRYFMPMVFGFVGAWNMLLMWPGLMIIDAAGIEPFELPPTWTVFGALAVNAIVGTNLSDVLWAKSVVLTSPLVATLGLSMTIPVALVYDLVIRGAPFSAMYLGGAGLVVLGFIVSNLRSG